MPFQVSPGVNVSEIDLTTVVPAVSTTEAGIGGVTPIYSASFTTEEGKQDYDLQQICI